MKRFVCHLLLLLGTQARDAFSYEIVERQNGYKTLATANFDVLLASDSQVLASLKAKSSNFDFLPFDLISLRSGNGQYHTGDITYQYREVGETVWSSGDSSSARQPVIAQTSAKLSKSDLSPTLPAGNLDIVREWIDVGGDLGLTFTLRNKGNTTLEVGSLGFPLEFNSIFTGRTSDEMQAKCSLHDPYIGLDAGYVQVVPLSGVGPALVVTPLYNTSFQAWRNLDEPYIEQISFGSQGFEGFYEWQTLTMAYAEREWKNVEPWNNATSKFLGAGASFTVGLRFSLALDGVRGIEKAVIGTGTPVAVGIPGYVVPSDLTSKLHLFTNSTVASITTHPPASLILSEVSSKVYSVTPSSTAWGRVRVTILYSDGKSQSVHYYVTKSGLSALKDVGNFATTKSWYNDTSDPFGRSPSPLSYDSIENKLVLQDVRAWIAGLSDEAGAGTYIAATMKQAAQPDAVEIAKLELFVDNVLFKTIQTPDYAVRKSIFYYDPTLLPRYQYDTGLDWTNWWSWNKESAYLTDRAYDYVHPVAAYWALYRAGRAYPELLSVHTWEWYLLQAYQSILAFMKPDQDGNCCEVGYALVGLMDETVIGEVLKDLQREGYTLEASHIVQNMSVRADFWETLSLPFGSEMSWDSTGQEGVYLWAKYFNHTSTVTKAVNSILGYMPSVAHWGWNGNARRYWDNIYGGKLQRIERQLHHYGSGLNALPILSHFRSNPTDSYLARIGYGGMNGPLTNINQEGFGAASFHSWPDTLAWDGYSGDYGPNFLGLVLGSGTYVVDDKDLGIIAYGGEISSTQSTFNVVTKDAVRHRVFIGPLGLFIEIDAGIIESFKFSLETKDITLTLTQLHSGPLAKEAIIWYEVTAGVLAFEVIGGSVKRGGKAFSLEAGKAEVVLRSM